MRGFGLVVLALLALGACSGSDSKEKIADKVEDRADSRADAIEAASKNIADPLQQNVVETQAKLVRDAGEERAEAIRQSQLQPEQLSDSQKKALIEGRQPAGTQNKVSR